VGTARRFRPPLYIHIRPLSRFVARHSSRRPLCRRREKRTILRARGGSASSAGYVRALEAMGKRGRGVKA